MLLDAHTHRQPPYPEGIIALRIGIDPVADLLDRFPDQPFSIGIHPWDTDTVPADDALALLHTLAPRPNVVAIGETGIDTGRGAPLFRQLQMLRQHSELAETLALPLVLHCVKADDMVCALRRDLRPRQPWVVHGYRGKPGGARLLLQAGCIISLGPQHNPLTAQAIPADALLAETDGPDASIADVIATLSHERGADATTHISALIHSIFTPNLAQN